MVEKPRSASSRSAGKKPGLFCSASSSSPGVSPCSAASVAVSLALSLTPPCIPPAQAMAARFSAPLKWRLAWATPVASCARRSPRASVLEVPPSALQARSMNPALELVLKSVLRLAPACCSTASITSCSATKVS